MNIYDCIILGIIIFCLIAAIAWMIRRKANGKSICCGCCESCSHNCSKKK